MNTEMLALKYRPKVLADLVGQPAVSQTLSNAITDGKIYNAYLFVGSWGTGKTSTARILAASLNCSKGPTVTPCGECKNCVDIFEGRSIDVKEIDAASNGKVDDVREIKGESNYRAVASRYRIFIIDEAHSLTREAVEAFLKVLEEAPDGVKFIFCTTDFHKIKNTIRSRAQTHFFGLISPSDIANHVKKVAQTEKIKIDDSAIRIVVKQSRGHMRDALKHLDTLVQFAGSEAITTETAQSALNGVDDNKIFALFDAVINKNMPKGYKAIQELLLYGQDVDQVLNSLLDHIWILALINTCDSTSGLISLHDDDKKKFIIQAKLIPASVCDDMISYLLNVHRGITYNMNPEVLLGQFLIKTTRSYYAAKAKAMAG